MTDTGRHRDLAAGEAAATTGFSEAPAATVATAVRATAIVELFQEFYKVEPESHETLNQAADRAVATFTARHPDLSVEAVGALRWYYTFDWK